MAVYYWLVFALSLSVNRNNLILNQWVCDSRSHIVYSQIIRSGQELKSYALENDLSCIDDFKEIQNFDFDSQTLLAQFAQPGNYCRLKNYTRLIYDSNSKLYVFSVVANGVGYCRKEAIAQSIIISTNRIPQNSLVKFRYKYVPCNYGNELTIKDADSWFTANDSIFDRVVVNY